MATQTTTGTATIKTTSLSTVRANLDRHENSDIGTVHLNALPVSDEDAEGYEFADLLPHFPDVKWAPLEDMEVNDRAHKADRSYKNLLGEGTKIVDLTSNIGSKIYGIKLNELNDKQKDELALLVALRGVVLFSDQDDFSPEDQIKLAEYYGPIHRHATTATPKKEEYDSIHVVYSDPKRKPNTPTYTNQELYHSDVTYERQPPGTTIFKLLTAPPQGGDTIFVSGYSAYDSFSKPMQEYLSKLSATHSGVEQADGTARAGLTVRRDAITTVHPVVRTHPVTGYNSLFVNPGFTRSIVGVPKSESDAILSLLFNTISQLSEGTVRIRWKKNDVALWDNRIIASHSATYDFFPHKRHAIRTCAHAEKPYFDPQGKSKLDEHYNGLGIEVSKDGSLARGSYKD